MKKGKGLPRYEPSERYDAVRVERNKDWLKPLILEKAEPPSGKILDAAIEFVHTYACPEKVPAEYFSAMTVGHYRKHNAAIRQCLRSKDIQTLARWSQINVGREVTRKLKIGNVLGAHFLSDLPENPPDKSSNGDSDKESQPKESSKKESPMEAYLSLTEKLCAITSKAPAASKDFKPKKCSSIEESYKNPTWLDKWKRAIKTDPIARIIKVGNREKARKSLKPNETMKFSHEPFDSFLDAWRKIQAIRKWYLPDSPGPVKDYKEMRLELAVDLALLAIEGKTREVLDEVGLWAAFDYLLYVEAWWLYLEHVVSRCSLPLDELHFDAQSTLGVGLLEAVSGMSISFSGAASYLCASPEKPPKNMDIQPIEPISAADKPKMQPLPKWQTKTANAFFKDILTLCAQSEEKPFILRKGIDQLKVKGVKKNTQSTIPQRSAYAVNAEQLSARWPHYPETHQIPLLRRDTWDPDGVGRRAYKHSRYPAQLKLFVAAQIAELATTELGLARAPFIPVAPEYNYDEHKHKFPKDKIPWDRSDDPSRTPVILSERPSLIKLTSDGILKKDSLSDDEVRALNEDRKEYLEALAARPPKKDAFPPLRLVAGCFPWGGRKPPHITHKDGLSYDVQMGADTQAWPKVNDEVGKFLSAVVTINWPVVLGVIAKDLRLAEILHASIKAYRIGSKDEKWRNGTVGTVNAEYKRLASKYKSLKEEFPDQLRFPLPLNAESRKAVQRFSLYLLKEDRRKEATDLWELVIQTQLGEMIAKRLVADPLFVRYSSTETDTFTGKNRVLVFRRLVADDIVNKAIALVHKVVCQQITNDASNFMTEIAQKRAAMLEKAKEIDIDKTWKQIEEILVDLPLAHNPAAVQRALIATLALLISGVRNIVYGSPLVFARAYRILVSCAQGDKPETHDSRVSEILLLAAGRWPEDKYRLCEFGFLPHNHYHHHHIEYGLENYEKMYEKSTTWGTNLLLEDLKSLREVWLNLGIDLSMFKKYLEDNPVTGSVPPQAKEERDEIVKYVARYVEEYSVRFRMPLATDKDDIFAKDKLSKENAIAFAKFARARLRLYSILKKTNESALVKGKETTAQGTRLSELCEQSIRLFKKLKPAVDYRATQEFLDKSRQAGQAISLESLEFWQDASLEQVTKSLSGRSQFQDRLQQVLNFKLQLLNEEDASNDNQCIPDHEESDSSSDFEEEDLFRKEIFEELILERAGVSTKRKK